jgi:hypothetical protein
MEWSLCKVQPGSLKAFSFDERLIVRAIAVLPTPAYRARIAVSQLLVYPPRYCVQVARDPDHVGPAPPVELPRLASGHFGLPPNHKTVEVHDADGCHRLPIVPLRVAVEEERARAGNGRADAPRFTATGYSKTFSIEEAFRNAVAALPRPISRRQDELTHVVVERIGATFCGAAGMNQLYVTVSRTRFAAGDEIGADPVAST